MTVKELKEKLNQFDDNLIVVIPNKEYYSGDSLFYWTPLLNISQGINEWDDSLFLDDYIEQGCDTCAHYDTDRKDQPCCSCVDWENWERYEDE